MWTEEFDVIFKHLSQSDSAIGPDALYAELIQEISSYHISKDTSMIDQAYKIASSAHSGQLRKSGEPYIIHPLCVAIILSKLKMDKETIEAALLHDVVEDTDMTNEDLANIFGDDVACLVDGLTKLSQLPYNFDLEEIQAANLRKMFLAMAKDIRVIIIKLADRLHNLRTLKHQPPEKQIKIAKETIEIYAPLAMRLGISKIKVELDDLSLLYLQPDTYCFLTKELLKLKPVQQAFEDSVIQKIESCLREHRITAKTYSRTKHLFSIYKKVKNQSKHIRDIYDTFAICIIVDSTKACYTTLGILHEKFSPLYGRFKDYIAMPKENMYQALHTTLLNADGKMFEVQIKTYDMLMVAEYGITAKWKYNEYENGKIVKSSANEKMIWLKQILDWQKDLEDGKDFLGTLKADFNLLSNRISCFTPKGDVKSLLQGSTPIDFAYSIHTAVGNTMIGSCVNKVNVPITTLLQNGDIVEIITSKNADGPQVDWLQNIKTPEAKNKINDWLKNNLNQENINKGIEIFKQYCSKNCIDSESVITSHYFDSAINFFNFKSKNAFWEALSANSIDMSNFIRHFSKISNYNISLKKRKPQFITIKDSKIDSRNTDIYYAKCCNPMPGDTIIGLSTKSHGISVHRAGCPNLCNIEKKSPNQLVDIGWSNNIIEDVKFSVSLDINVINRIGLLEDISNVLANNSIDIKSINVKTQPDQSAKIEIVFYISNRQTLSKLVTEITSVQNVCSVERTFFS